jgi:hypothetical protein
MFVCAWLAIAATFVIIASNDSDLPSIPLGHGISSDAVSGNHIAGLSFVRRDPDKANRPVFSFSFQRLQPENSRLGMFATPLHKVLNVSDLGIRQFHYCDVDAALSPIPTSDLNPLDSTRPDRPGDLTTLWAKLADDAAVLSGRHFSHLDLTNTSEIRIRNFDYQVYEDGKLLFSVVSKQANLSHEFDGIFLRGHVTITAADGTTLETNRVKWDAESRLFRVDGSYVIKGLAGNTTGKGISVDYQLNKTPRQTVSAS